MKRIVLIACLLCTALVIKAAENVKVGSLWYEVDNAKTYATVIKAQEGDSYTGAIVIPDSIKVPVGEDTEDSVYVKVTTIGNAAFANTKITEITIPATVTSIKSQAFACRVLEKATYASVKHLCDIDFASAESNPLYLASKKHLFFSGSELETTDLEIPEGVTTIKAYAFVNNLNLTSVIIPSSVRAIGGDAFYMDPGSSKLSKVTYASVADLCSIDYNSLSSNPLYNAHRLYVGDKEVTEISIPASSLVNGDIIRAFILAGASRLLKVSIPVEAKYIKASAFQGCTSLDYVEYGSLSQLTSMWYANNTANPQYYAKNMIIDGKFSSILEIDRNIQDNAFNNAKWLETVIIKEGVTSIGKNAFQECTNLTQVTLPSTLKTISARAFRGCQRLENPKLPDGLTYLGDEAFYDCKSANFKSIAIPNSCSYLGKGVFTLCTQLQAVTLPAGIDSLRNLVFDRCYNLKDLTLPASVKVIGEQAFRSCERLTVFPAGGSVETIMANAFQNCKGITNLILPDKVMDIKTGAFQGCEGLTMISLPASVKAIGSNAFDCGTALQHVFCLGSEVPTTSPSAFSSPELATLHVVDEAAKAKFAAADPWKNFGSIALKKEYTLTFYVNDKAEKVIKQDGGSTINPDSIYVPKLGEGDSFSGWDKEVPQTMPSEDTELYGYISTEVGIGDFKYHLMPAEQKNGANLIPRATVIGLNRELTVNDTQLAIKGELTYKTVSYPVTAIGPNAFKGQGSVQRIGLPGCIESVGNAAFMGCSNLMIVENMDKVTEISDSVFFNCTSLSEVALSGDVTKIGRLAFGNCRNLKLTKLPAALTTLGTQAFANTDLDSVSLSANFTSMGEEVFKECKKLKKVVLQDGFSLPVPKLTFWNCTSLQELTLSGSTPTVLESAFQGCNMLKTLVLPEGLTSVGTTAFKGCSQLISVTLPSTLSAIGSKAFEGCAKLRQVKANRQEAPFCANDAFTDSTYKHGFLFVKDVAQYKGKDPWSKFKNISTGELFVLTYVVDGKDYKRVGLMAGTPITPEAAPTKEDREFSGWQLPESMPAQDITVRGGFKYAINYYKHVKTPDSLICQNTFFYDSLATIPVEQLHREGYKYTISGLTAGVITEDDAASFRMKMKAKDTAAIVTYQQIVYDVTEKGVVYRVNTKDNYVEVVESKKEYATVNIPAALTYDGKNYPVTIIRDRAFAEDKKLSSIILPTTLDSIGKQAFCNSTLEGIEIPSSVKKMGTDVFMWCTRLKEVEIKASLSALPSGTFLNCLSLEEINVPSQITAISDYTFSGCTSLKQVTLSDKLQTIGDRAFWGALGEDGRITLGSSLPKALVTTFDEKTYQNTTLLTSVSSLTAPWDNFVNAEPLEGGSGVAQCEKPTITYEAGKLKFACKTEGATIISEVVIPDMQKSEATEIELSKTYIVKAYAKKAGWRRSDIETKEYTWMVGDANGDGVVDIADAVRIVNFVVGKIDALSRQQEVIYDPE